MPALILYQIQYEYESVLSHSVLCHIVSRNGRNRTCGNRFIRTAPSPLEYIPLFVDIIFHVLLYDYVYDYDELLYWHIRIYHIYCFPSAYGGRKSMRGSYSPIQTLLNNIYFL